MNTQLWARKNSKQILLGMALPILWTSTIKNPAAVFVQIPLSIQTSKADPPRIAFDEINASLKASQEKSQASSVNLNEGPKLKGSVFNRKVVLNSMVFSKEEATREVERLNADVRWIETLSTSERKRVEAANQKFGSIETDLRNPSFQEMVQEKLNELKKEAAKEPAAASRVIVQGAEPLQKADVQVKPKSLGFEVSGEFVLRGLPPPSSNWHVDIARYDEEVKKEDAHIDTRRAVYKVRVPELSGSIKARLVDSTSGMVIGEGHYRLSQYVAGKISGQAKIVIEPASNQVASNFRSFYNSARGVPTQVLAASVGLEGKADASGYYKMESVQNGSWSLLRTQSRGFYSGMHLVRAGEEKNLTLFPEKMMQALQQIVAEQAYASQVPANGSVVWGQVKQDGKPLAGVEVDAEFLENYRPVYFNTLLLPDPTLKSTSENGYYAFLNLPEGFHSIVASRAELYISHANVVVDENTVSTADMESTNLLEKSKLKVFDAFTGGPLSANLELQSLPQSLDVDGYAEIDLSPISRLSMMRVHPANEDYMEATLLYEDTADSLRVPLIRGAWLQTLIAQKKINIQADTGIVVGFLANGNYQMYLGHQENFPVENLVYFDAQGEPSENAVDGGGVVIFNVPAGVQSMVAVQTEDQMIQTQVAPIDPRSVTVLKFR